MPDPWNDFIAPNYYTARVHISKYWQRWRNMNLKGG